MDHALALLMTQVCPTEEGQEYTTIKRLKKENVKDSTPSDIPISYYHGPKKPEMPEEVLEKCVLPLKAQQRILVQRLKFHDFDFLGSVATKPSTPELVVATLSLHGCRDRTKSSYQCNVHTADWHDSFRPNYNEKCYAGGQETNKESWSSNNYIYCRSSTLSCGSQWTFWLGLHPSSWANAFFDELCWCCGGSDGCKWAGRANESCLWGCNENAHW